MKPVTFHWVLVLLLASVACVDIEGPAPEPLAPNEVLSRFGFSTRSIMTAVGDTLPLKVEAFAPDGSPIAVDMHAVRWISLDSASVYIDSTGMMTSKTVNALPINIIAIFRYGPTTKADTIPVLVTQTRLTATSIKLVTMDSMRTGAGPIFVHHPNVRIDLLQNGVTILTGARLPVSASSRAIDITYIPNSVTPDEGTYQIQNALGVLGHFWVRSSVNLYGREVADSALFQGIYPTLLGYFTLQADEQGSYTFCNSCDSEVLTRGYNVSPCAVILFIHSAGATNTTVDVVFSDSANASPGCTEVPIGELAGFGLPPHSSTTEGNILSMPQLSVATRNVATTNGRFSFYVRNAITKQRLSEDFYVNVLPPE